ncbi:tRNA-2-methylthio-N6-dimethylallyladenosine synthase [Anaerocolumna xylanovorans DSM 12503]|uniref:tRNA-2-methylthio-N6-dimethylallyladenosine synthase n=2 Tax=Anaerocolumna TaxID=1843210 RepID=A0A1M7YC13_9FIRM|nr:tRNA-2-methylthio-N6-dimethylallyladenosine synthase [Anaerocolumna xylanovorans DSM 12503]
MSSLLMNLEDVNLDSKEPINEPQRQYYFMAKCREWVKRKEEELNRQLTFSVVTFGCPTV